MTLTKANIVEAVAEQIGYTKNQSVNTIETFLELIKRSLESGEDVLVSGFGKFCVKEKRERRGRNPSNRRGYDAGTQECCDLQVFPATEG